MFTVETEFDLTKVTVLDETGGVDDLIVRFAEEGIYVSQWSEHDKREITIYLNDKMFNELMLAYNSNDGTFVTR